VRKSKIIYTIVIMIAIIICSCGICEAAGTLPSLSGGYKPTVSGGGATSIINTILSALTIVGICVLVVAIALIGFNMMLGSASEKAVAKEKFIGIIIAAVLLTTGSILARFIISAAQGI